VGVLRCGIDEDERGASQPPPSRLGLWGLIAALGTAPTGVSGAPVLVFHFTWAHAAVLIGAGVLSLVSTRKFRWGFWFSVAQAVGFITLFITTMDERTWISDLADNALHAGIGIAGTGLLLWVAARALSAWHWRTPRRGRTSC
jgi:hypothetical protein